MSFTDFTVCFCECWPRCFLGFAYIIFFYSTWKLLAKPDTLYPYSYENTSVCFNWQIKKTKLTVSTEAQFSTAAWIAQNFSFKCGKSSLRCVITWQVVDWMATLQHTNQTESDGRLNVCRNGARLLLKCLKSLVNDLMCFSRQKLNSVKNPQKGTSLTCKSRK